MEKRVGNKKEKISLGDVLYSEDFMAFIGEEYNLMVYKPQTFFPHERGPRGGVLYETLTYWNGYEGDECGWMELDKDELDELFEKYLKIAPYYTHKIKGYDIICEALLRNKDGFKKLEKISGPLQTIRKRCYQELSVGTSATAHLEDIARDAYAEYRLIHRKLKAVDDDNKMLTFILFYEQI